MSSAAKTKREVLSEFRSGEILLAARKVFAGKGFDQSTVDDIADEAGVAKGTLYLYFRSKLEIYLAALRQGISELHAETSRRMEACATVDEKIRAFVTTRFQYFETNRDFFKIYYSEFSNLLIHQAPVRQDFRDLYWLQAKALRSVLDEGMAQGLVRRDRTETLTLVIYDMARGLIAQRLLGWSKTPVEDDIEFLIDQIWRAIACQED